MNLLRRPQESVTNLKNLNSFKHMRMRLVSLVGLFLPLVLTAGFFTAGTSAGSACNTFPWVGEHYFYTRNHFMKDIPFWKNFTENKLVC
jgi:heme A synthase